MNSKKKKRNEKLKTFDKTLVLNKSYIKEENRFQHFFLVTPFQGTQHTT